MDWSRLSEGERNALVATKVMGWTFCHCPFCKDLGGPRWATLHPHKHHRHVDSWKPSASYDDALLAVRTVIQRLGIHWMVECMDDEVRDWAVGVFEGETTPDELSRIAVLAIERAAVLAVEGTDTHRSRLSEGEE
jgi:hypothetical protein